MDTKALNNLEKLSELHEKGILTDEEFNTQKQKLLESDASSEGNDLETKLVKLSELHDKGLLNDEEFAKKKEDTLNEGKIEKASAPKANKPLFLANKTKYFVKEDIVKLDKEIENLDQGTIDKLGSLSLQDIDIMFIISLLVGEFGVDRFLLGHIGMGIGKLLLTFVTLGFVWWIVDLFLIKKAASEHNYELVMKIINENKKSEPVKSLEDLSKA